MDKDIRKTVLIKRICESKFENDYHLFQTMMCKLQLTIEWWKFLDLFLFLAQPVE